MVERLPRDFVVETDSDWPQCPWCAADMSEATVTLGNLADAWNSFTTERPGRTPEGKHDPGALRAECPACQRPSIIALQGDQHFTDLGCWRRTRLLAVRTAADLRLLGVPEGWYL